MSSTNMEKMPPQDSANNTTNQVQSLDIEDCRSEHMASQSQAASKCYDDDGRLKRTGTF